VVLSSHYTPTYLLPSIRIHFLHPQLQYFHPQPKHEHKLTTPDDRNPDLFQKTPTHEIPHGLTPQTLSSIVLSYATAFPETSSRLTSLNDLPVPDAQSSASLIELQPQIDRLAEMQTMQAKEISELRVRSASALQRWYEVGLVGSGEVWAEWEGRIEGVEKGTRRMEVGRLEREEV
jgi:hypothetical protein